VRRRGNEGHGTQERVVSLEVFRECVLGVREMIDLKSRGLLLAIRRDFRATRKILNELAIATESARGQNRITRCYDRGSDPKDRSRESGQEGTRVAETSSTERGERFVGSKLPTKAGTRTE
jgi:hypothetical protein